MIQKGFEQNPNKSPKYWQSTLKLGKVIGVKADDKTVDIAMMNGGATYYDVPVLAPMATTSSGISHLPKPHNPKAKTEEGYDVPEAFEKRDIFAIVGFVEGIGSMPVVLGFQQPKVSQLSFSNLVGANHHIDRHESDRYHRITGDTVAKFGGADVSGEEEVRYPDNSYYKVVKAGGSKALTDLSQKNRDKDTQPFTVKKEDRKGFFFQHVSGSRVWIGHDGEIKIAHHTGTWFSIGPSTGNVDAETVSIKSVDSANDPPAVADSSTAQIHIEHSSGTKINIDASGNLTITGVGNIAQQISGSSTETITGTKTITAPAINGAAASVHLGTGTFRALLDSRTHTYLGSLVTALNTWLNNHTHPDPVSGNTAKPNQTAALSSPPVLASAATSNTRAS